MKADKPIDIITVTENLHSQGKLEEVGGPFYVTQLTSKVASSAHIEEHALIIQQKYIQRQAIELSHALQRKAYDNAEDISDVLFNAGKRIEEIQEGLIGSGGFKSFADVLVSMYEDLQQRTAKFATKGFNGITTGLSDLDRMTSGWQGSELIIIAARPAMGKTAMALHFAKSAAQSEVPVAIFSLEMSDISLSNRIVLSQCNVNPGKFKSGDLTSEDFQMIDRAVAEIYQLPIWIDDDANVTMSHIRSKCRLLKKKGKCGLIIIDYLQLATGERTKSSNREQEISAMSREAKLIAKELNVPVLLLSQLNRDVEKRPDKRPMLSDLRESGAIEQDADMVIFVHRPGVYGLTDSNGNVITNAGELIIAKHRNGAIGTVKFGHNDSLTSIFDYGTNLNNPFYDRNNI